MPQAPRWTPEEFETILAHPDLSDAELAGLLPRRNANGVQFVRTGICYWHTGQKNNRVLSAMARRRLEERSDGIKCAKCGEVFRGRASGGRGS